MAASKLLSIIRAFIDDGTVVSVVVPGVGPVLSKVESLVGDVVTVAPTGAQKIVMHYTQFVVQRN